MGPTECARPRPQASVASPMLATRLDDSRLLADPRYIAAPKLAASAQLHVREHRPVHAFSRPGRELIRLPGLA
jgi:hypothetical protein